jgi:hypothetical protein
MRNIFSKSELLTHPLNDINLYLNMLSLLSSSPSPEMSSSHQEKYLLSFYVPTANTESCTSAIFKTGAGRWPGGTYEEVCFTIRGTGQFRPTAIAKPHIGKIGELEKLEEDRVEMVVFGRETVVNAVAALKEAHPYEVVAYFVVRCEDI